MSQWYPSPIESWFEERKPESAPGQLLVWFPDGHAEAHERFEIDGVVYEVHIEDNDERDDGLVTKNGEEWDFAHFHKGHLITSRYLYDIDDPTYNASAYLAPFKCLALYKPLGGDVIGVVCSFLR